MDTVPGRAMSFAVAGSWRRDRALTVLCMADTFYAAMFTVLADGRAVGDD